MLSTLTNLVLQNIPYGEKNINDNGEKETGLSDHNSFLHINVD